MLGAGRMQRKRSSQSLLRPLWMWLRELLGRSNICLDVANQLYEKEVLSFEELEEITAQRYPRNQAADQLLHILCRGSEESCLTFVQVLRTHSVQDARKLGARIMKEAGVGEIEHEPMDEVVEMEPDEDISHSRSLMVKRSLEAAAYYHNRCSEEGRKLEPNSTMPVSWKRLEVRLPPKFQFPTSTTATVVDNNLLVARRGDATIYMINLESGDSESLTTETRPWVIMQLFRMKNKCLALVKTSHGYQIVCYDNTPRVVCQVPYTEGLAEMSAVATDTDIYIIGGTVGYSSLTTGQVLRYSQGQWEAITEMPTPRSLCTCVLRGDQLVIAGGSPGGFGNMTNIVEMFNLSTGTWQDLPSTTMMGCQLVCLAGTMIATGGRTAEGVISDHVEMLDGTGCWAALPPMTQHRICHAVCDTQDMKIIVAGGHGLHTTEIMEIAED